ncbi:MAG: type II toxin-antitoxin system RelE/ParE family toxin [Desulfitobacteriaceae bacterium]
MANYKIKILQIAQEDMKAIVAHIRIDDPDAAIRMYEKIKASISKLSNFPLMGPVPLDRKIAGQGYRMIVIDPYLVFYILVMEDNTVEVHRVLHGKQDFSNILE